MNVKNRTFPFIESEKNSFKYIRLIHIYCALRFKQSDQFQREKEKEEILNRKLEQKKVEFLKEQKINQKFKNQETDLQEELGELQKTEKDEIFGSLPLFEKGDLEPSEDISSIECYKESVEPRTRKSRKKSDLLGSNGSNLEFPHFYYCKLCMVTEYYSM